MHRRNSIPLPFLLCLLIATALTGCTTTATNENLHATPNWPAIRTAAQTELLRQEAARPRVFLYPPD